MAQITGACGQAPEESNPNLNPNPNPNPNLNPNLPHHVHPLALLPLLGLSALCGARTLGRSPRPIGAWGGRQPCPHTHVTGCAPPFEPLCPYPCPCSLQPRLLSGPPALPPSPPSSVLPLPPSPPGPALSLLCDLLCAPSAAVSFIPHCHCR